MSEYATVPSEKAFLRPMRPSPSGPRVTRSCATAGRRDVLEERLATLLVETSRARRGVQRKPIESDAERGFRADEATAPSETRSKSIASFCSFVTERPFEMPPLRHARIDMPFGERDADDVLGESPAAWALRDALAYASAAVGHVLVMGESGTGKELAAQAIHARSSRQSKPFVSHNSATFPAGLIDAELFGSARNYPNAGMPERAGLVGDADGGVLFLDEIGELPPELHARLLRVLDDGGEYKRVGESTARRSDFRLVTATNRDPAVLKHDLHSRLRVRITIPSLRERREDVPLLARAIVLEAAALSPETAGRFVHSVEGG
jgi:transcriptional regulator with AAA-type ATPase domain